MGIYRQPSALSLSAPFLPFHYMSLRAQKDRQPRYSDNQRAYVPPEWSRRKNDWTEKIRTCITLAGNFHQPLALRACSFQIALHAAHGGPESYRNKSIAKGRGGSDLREAVSGPCDEMLEVPDHFPFADYMDTNCARRPVVVPNVLLFREIAPH